MTTLETIVRLAFFALLGWSVGRVFALSKRVAAMEDHRRHRHTCPPSWTLTGEKYARCDRCGWVDKSVRFDLPEDA